ncbi:MAG: Gfo/Idh/MocA family oxidoreductase [Actinomycetota bacterium]
MRAVVVGSGTVGARAGRQLLFLGHLDDVVVVDAYPARAAAVAESFGRPARAVDGNGLASLEPGDVALLATPNNHRALAEEALERGAHVVSVGDGPDDVRALLALDAAARAQGLNVVVGAGFAPGLTCVLAALAARAFERVVEIRVAKVGTGGPACGRQQQAALKGEALDWRDGQWHGRRAGSGREQCWFPDPVRGIDCYRASLADAVLLHHAFPEAERVSARLGASRRDRLAAHLPLRPKVDPEGELGAVRVEVRGAQGVALDDRVLGAVDRPAVAAGAVAAMAARWALDGRLSGPGASGLAGLVEPGPFLAALAERGVKVAVFEGSEHGNGNPLPSPSA